MPHDLAMMACPLQLQQTRVAHSDCEAQHPPPDVDSLQVPTELQNSAGRPCFAICLGKMVSVIDANKTPCCTPAGCASDRFFSKQNETKAESGACQGAKTANELFHGFRQTLCQQTIHFWQTICCLAHKQQKHLLKHVLRILANPCKPFATLLAPCARHGFPSCWTAHSTSERNQSRCANAYCERATTVGHVQQLSSTMQPQRCTLGRHGALRHDLFHKNHVHGPAVQHC